MGDFRSNGPRRDSRGGFGGRPSGNRFGGGRSSGGFGGNRGGFGGERRSFGARDGARLEMHEVTCDKCGKQCRVPFKPSGGKPVYCSDCFRQNEGGTSNNFRSSPRGNDRSSSAPVASGMSQEQFNQINAKLDKILKIMEEVAEDEDDDELDADMDLDEDDEKVE